MKRTKRRMTVCTVLLICNLVFIWGNSLLPAEVSGQISGSLKAFLDGLFSPGEAAPSGDGLLRKCAHFAEFGALGLLLGWLFGMLGKKRLPAFALGVAARRGRGVLVPPGRIQARRERRHSGQDPVAAQLAHARYRDDVGNHRRRTVP